MLSKQVATRLREARYQTACESFDRNNLNPQHWRRARSDAQLAALPGKSVSTSTASSGNVGGVQPRRGRGVAEWEEGRSGGTTFRHKKWEDPYPSANHTVKRRFNDRIGKLTIDTSDLFPIDTIEVGSVSPHDNV